jgi:hypothetical protein
MTLSIVDFLNARLKDEAEAAQKIPSGHPVEYLALVFKAHGMDKKPGDGDELLGVLWAAEHLADYARRWPQLNDFRARVLREVAAKRRVMERHSLSDASRITAYCAGCPSGDDSGYPDTELQDCPELQDMAFVWNDHEDWSTAWCPHVEGRTRVAVSDPRAPEGSHTNACNRCGQGDGWRR